MSQSDCLENIYANLIKDFKEKVNRNLTDEELTFLKWLAQEQLETKNIKENGGM
ncbi:hypothetical protein [Lentibacillus amyloliquefaciens]|uniref:hypothetical protein n=1 Tax=Lentibacillus amyloliquefaciens TaxID=1472767 RepID=UPI0012E3E429|nr:hypothetical protein [Lentibacillus amyloliquefaciens]